MNKDYQLPKICLFYKLEQNSPPDTISKIVSYLFTQTYLNAELLIIGNNVELPDQGKNFIKDNNQFVYYHNNKLNQSLGDIFPLYTNTNFRVEISNNKLLDNHYIEKIYEEKIKPIIMKQEQDQKQQEQKE